GDAEGLWVPRMRGRPPPDGRQAVVQVVAFGFLAIQDGADPLAPGIVGVAGQDPAGFPHFGRPALGLVAHAAAADRQGQPAGIAGDRWREGLVSGQGRCWRGPGRVGRRSRRAAPDRPAQVVSDVRTSYETTWAGR